MTFFRIKRIKGKEYAYIVENKWQRKSSRQKVKGYLGRVYRFELKNSIDFPSYFKIDDAQNYIESNDKKKVIKDLIEWELYRFGVDRNQFFIDLNNIKIQRNKRDVALAVNEGIICGHTLKNLFGFKPEDEATDGYRLAKAFVEAGIKVPEHVFVKLCQKLFSF